MSDQEIKLRIHEKALQHFLQYGFSKVTMNEIAEDLGMSKKTLYHYFPSKEELLASVMDKMHRDTASEIDLVVEDKSTDFIQKLRGVLNILSSFHGKMTPHFLADIEKHAPGVCQCSNDFKRDRIRKVVGQLITEGVQKGVFRNDVDVELITLIYVGALQHILRPDIFSRLSHSVFQIHQVIGKVIIEGILADEAREKIRNVEEEVLVVNS